MPTKFQTMPIIAALFSISGYIMLTITLNVGLMLLVDSMVYVHTPGLVFWFLRLTLLRHHVIKSDAHYLTVWEKSYMIKVHQTKLYCHWQNKWHLEWKVKLICLHLSGIWTPKYRLKIYILTANMLTEYNFRFKNVQNNEEMDQFSDPVNTHE